MSSEAALPYGGASDPNSGFAGSETSAERARYLDGMGVTGKRQRQIVQALATVGERGLTWREVATMLEVHHGAASGPLSNLHKTGRIARLIETRLRSKVYVLPEYVNGRPTERAKPNQRDPFFEDALPLLSRLTCDRHEGPVPSCQRCIDSVAAFRLIRRYQREVQSQ